MRQVRHIFRSLSIGSAFFALSLAGPHPAMAQWLEQPSSVLETSGILEAFPWHPKGTGTNPLARECRRAALEKIVETPRATATEIARQTQNWLSTCEAQIARQEGPSFGPLLEYVALDHTLRGQSSIRKVTFTLSDGRKLGAILALKNDTRPRPLVIAKAGLYADANDNSSTRSFFMHLFEESPFNLVILASSTGAEFSMANHSVSFGGLDEGYQIIDIARQLRAPSSPLKDRISSLHAVGYSMGSHGVLYASLYASQKPIQSVTGLSSAIAVCPVVDLGASIQRGFNPSARGLLFKILTLQTLRRIFASVPILGQMLNPELHPSRSELYSGLTAAAVAYFKDLTETAPWAIPPLEGTQIRTVDDLFRVNRFQDHVGQVHVPTYLVYSKDDELVEPEFNAEGLTTELKASPNASIGIIGFRSGSHCALSAANGWENVSTLLRSLIIARSPKDDALWGVTRVKVEGQIQSWRWPSKFRLGPDARVTRVGWQITSGRAEAELTVQVFTPAVMTDQFSCAQFESRLEDTDPSCLRYYRGKVPLTTFARLGLRIPKTESEASAMTRWLNSNSELLDDEGSPFIGSGHAPATLVARGRFEL